LVFNNFLLKYYQIYRMLSQNFALMVLQNIHDISMSKLQKRANNLLWLDSAPHDSACAKHVADRHYEFRMFRLPPIFQMRFIYEYVTKSRGKPSWTWGMVFRSRRNGGFAYIGVHDITSCLSTISRHSSPRP